MRSSEPPRRFRHRRFLGAVVRALPDGRAGARAGRRRNAGRYLVVKVNTDAVPELGERFRIRSIPTMAVFEGGREVPRTSGARPAADIEAFVRQSRDDGAKSAR